MFVVTVRVNMAVVTSGPTSLTKTYWTVLIVAVHLHSTMTIATVVTDTNRHTRVRGGSICYGPGRLIVVG